jgi:hypothetical protein
MKRFFLVILFSVLLLSFSNPAVESAIDYGDFVGDTITFQSVTESSTTNPGEPLFGGTLGPIVVGDQLYFFPNTFASSSSNGSADTTSGTLQMTLTATSGYLQEVRISEVGDYSLTGEGGVGTQAHISGLLTVTPLGPGGVQTDFESEIYQLPSDSSGPVSLEWVILFSIPYPTMAILNFNNNLQTSSEESPFTTAFIQKKVVDGPSIGISVNPIPVPGAIWLLGSGLITLLGVRRRFR